MKNISDIIATAEEYAKARNIELSTLGNLVMNNPRHYERLKRRNEEMNIAKEKLAMFIKNNPASGACK